MVEIEIRKTQSITNEQLGKYYAKFLTENDLDGLNEDLAYAIDNNIADADNIDIDFDNIIAVVRDLSWIDIAEIFESTAQYLRHGIFD